MNKFLSIEKARFGEKLIIEQNIDVHGNLQIPSFTLQPLIENAIKHGLEQANESLIVRLMLSQESEILKAEIWDSAEGLRGKTIEELTDKGVGIQNVRDRLKYVYGDEAELRIEGSSIIIIYPLTESQTS